MNSYQNLKDRSVAVGGMRVDAVEIPEITELMETWIHRKERGHYIVVSNANDVAQSRRDPRVMDAVNNSSLSIPDGFSLVLLLRMFGYRQNRRAYGPDLMVDFLKYSEGKSYSHFFYGGTEEVLSRLTGNLKQKFPGLNVAGFYSPPFGQLASEEEQDINNMINEAHPDVLWVALGCPKQQIWMHEHKGKLNVPVMVGVGAAFDFIAGEKKQAPKWMRESGLEWLFRLCTEPRRLWRRYLIGNTIFVWLSLKELIRYRLMRR